MRGKYEGDDGIRLRKIEAFESSIFDGPEIELAWKFSRAKALAKFPDSTPRSRQGPDNARFQLLARLYCLKVDDRFRCAHVNR
jgi:hypothetical protein